VFQMELSAISLPEVSVGEEVMSSTMTEVGGMESEGMTQGD